MFCNTLKKFKNSRGFGSIESFSAISLMSILTVVAIPSAIKIKNNYIKNQSRAVIEKDFVKAKNFAINNRKRIVMNFTIGANGYSFGIDNPPYSLDNTYDEHIFSATLPSGVTILSAYDVVLNKDGTGIDSTGKSQDAIISLAKDGEVFESYTITSKGELEY